MSLPDEAATEDLGLEMAKMLIEGEVLPVAIGLSGDLGAGKTTLARSFLRGLGHVGAVKSPTYALLESYLCRGVTVHHFDFYRFDHESEFLDSGLSEYFGQEAVCLVEWPEKAGGYMPAMDLMLTFSHEGSGRKVAIADFSPTGRTCLARWQRTTSVGTSRGLRK